MKLYDEAIKKLLEKIKDLSTISLDYETKSWEDVGDHNLILRQEMAYELGGSTHDAISAMGITSDDKIVPCDSLSLIGPDLNEIKEDTSYARIAIIRVSENGLGEGNTLYNAVRKIEYVRYHVSPKGYMTRISAAKEREPVRVSKEALKDGLSIAHVGKLFLDKYHENKNIIAVKLIFITDPSFDYKSIKEDSTLLEGITGTIDHIGKNVVMDCNACNLKPICDEVEGLKELHFNSSKF
ncbi:MAG: carbon monoxide dehydrogenase [Lachnospiraceae bacterium]|nr:carbon monoxide dehydrogenase [Lachnospiraceae bacterium]